MKSDLLHQVLLGTVESQSASLVVSLFYLSSFCTLYFLLRPASARARCLLPIVPSVAVRSHCSRSPLPTLFPAVVSRMPEQCTPECPAGSWSYAGGGPRPGLGIKADLEPITS